MKEDKRIEKMIRESLEFEKTSEGFSDKIMAKIEAAETKEEMALGSMISKFAVESPSADFTSSVMSRIQGAPSIVTNPVIIGKKAWMLIVALVSVFIYYVVSSVEQGPAEPAPYADLMNKVGEGLSQAGGSMSFQLPEIFTNPVFALSMFALSSLLLGDYLLKKRKLSVI